MLRKLAFLFRSRGHADNIKSSNLDIDHQAIMQAHARHDFDGAVQVAAAGEPPTSSPPPAPRRNAGPGWREYLAIGLDEPIIEVSGAATSASSRSTSSATLRDGRRVDERPVADA
mgnify:CR=1 FL=1